MTKRGSAQSARYFAVALPAPAVQCCAVERRLPLALRVFTVSLSGVNDSRRRSCAPPRRARRLVFSFSAMGEADRQRAAAQARSRRHQLAPHRVAAFAVQHLAGAQVALGHRGDVAAKAGGLAGRLAAALPTGPRCSARARSDDRACTSPAKRPLASVFRPYLPEAVGGVVVRRLQHDIDAPAQVAKHRPAVALERGDDFHHARLLQHAAVLARPHAHAADRRRRRAETAIRSRARRARRHWQSRPSRSRTWCRRGRS